MKTSNRTHFNSLTGLRAIAAIMVFCFHLRKFWVDRLSDIFDRILNEFHIGVSIFFVLSGFLIAYTYRDKPLDSNKEYFKYILVRMVRIFPVYLALLTLKYASGPRPSGEEMLLNYTLFKGFSDSYILTGIPQSWSLTVEMTFYCLAPFLYMAGKEKKWKPLLYLFLLFVAVSLAGFVAHKTGHNKDSFLYDYFFVLDSTFFGRFFEFYTGMFLAWRLEKRQHEINPVRGVKATLSGIAGIALCIFLIGCFAEESYLPGVRSMAGLQIRNLLLPVCTAVLLYGLITETNFFKRVLSTRVFVLLGNASFIFYLMHINYGYYALARIKKFGDYNFTFLWVVSIGAYFLFERPVYNFAKKKIKSLWNNVPPATSSAITTL